MRVKSLISYLADSSFYTKRIILLVTDTLIIFLSVWGAVALRMEQLWPPVWQEFFWLPFLVVLVSLPVFIRFGMYRAVIRYTSFAALWVIFKASFCSALLMVALLLIHGISDFSRSVPIIYFILAFLLLGGSRLVFRSIYSELHAKNKTGKRVLIYGAGSSGRQMVIAFQNSSEFTPVCFVDDEKVLQGRDLLGFPIYAPEQIRRLIEVYGINLVFLAMPSETRKRRREILRILEPIPVEVKSLPSLDELVTNDVSIKDIQDIQIEDLLGRDPVPPQEGLLRSCITGKNVMVTGAGGSIGSELCRQIAVNEPRRLVLFERSEFALYSIESELRTQFGNSLEIVPVLGSVTHGRRVLAVIRAHAIETVYHAAAYKHVPLVEYNPIEGLRNNVFGTLKTAEAAVEGGVETFVFISSDKAVRPANVMGASKRMAELVLQALAEKGGKTRFTMVRFGNVLGSSGSVIPHFRNQIRNGGPVTVTHPDVVRYFMTNTEAVQLVIQAGAMGTGGDVFVLNMGGPVRIIDLARHMIHLCGYTVRDSANPNGDIPIKFTGLRPGEKLYEELLVGDNVVGTSHPMIMRAAEKLIPWGKLVPVLDELDTACRNFDYERLRSILLETVDGYSPQCAIIDPVWKSMKEKDSLEARKNSLMLLVKKT